MNYHIEPLFCDLKEGDFEILLQNAQKKSFLKNIQVIKEGDQSRYFYVINSGKVKVFLRDEQGKEIVLVILGKGDYFGEMALIDDEVRSAAVMTLEDCEFSMISRQDFRDCMVKHPDIVEKIMQGLVRRLRNANRKIASLALMDVYGRVANILIDLAKEHDGQMIVEEKMTHQEIANMVGASREMVTRILKDLVEDGYITIDKNRRIILKNRE